LIRDQRDSAMVMKMIEFVHVLKSSSLCLYSSNLGTFWLKIEQFCSFGEISIFSNSSHLECRVGLSDTILKGAHPGTGFFMNFELLPILTDYAN
jgi:hypothetical protein